MTGFEPATYALRVREQTLEPSKIITFSVSTDKATSYLGTDWGILGTSPNEYKTSKSKVYRANRTI